MQDPDHPNKENLIDLEVKVRNADYRYVTAFARYDISDEENNVSSNSVWVLRSMTSSFAIGGHLGYANSYPG